MIKLVRKEPKTLLSFLTFTGKSEFTKSDFFLAFQNCKTKENKKKKKNKKLQNKRKQEKNKKTKCILLITFTEDISLQ